MNKVIYGAYTFQDADLNLLQGGKATMYYSPLGDELRSAYFSIPVQFYPRVWQTPAEDFKAGLQYAAPVDLYEDSTLLLRFYLTDITGGERKPDGSYTFNLVGTDFVGLFTSVPHLGGMYSAATAGNVIAEILGAQLVLQTVDTYTYETAGGIEYTVDADTATSRIDNWLPATQDARNNLRSVLQLVNACPQQNADGSPHFGPIDPGTKIDVSPYDTYAGDQYAKSDPVTAVQVVEYAYFEIAGTAEEVIYDASVEGANNDLVVFDKPYYGIHGDADLALNGSGANYARISGTGKLYGKPYTIASRTLISSTGQVGAENVKTIDNSLCSSLYSGVLLLRLVKYFGTAKVVQNAVGISQFFKPGHLLGYMDPMGEAKEGHPTEMTLTFSGLTKVDEEITADWSPEDEAPYTQYQLITASGTWTPPAGVTRIRFVLIGGGKGGWGGYKGADAPTGVDNEERYGGKGGAVGEGGDGGKVLQIDLAGNDIAASYTVTIGAAGAAGAKNHGEGTEGGNTTLTDGVNSYSSADGIRYPFGVLNVLTGDRYAAKGQDGVYAGKDGLGIASKTVRETITDAATSQDGNITTWTDGEMKFYYNGGGGCAYGANGQDGYYQAPYGPYTGGDGADATLDGYDGYDATPTIPGTGGIGGNGGGGGGAAGYTEMSTTGNIGSGGDGSVGGTPAPGAVLALMAFGAPPTPVDDHYLLDSNGQQLLDSNYEKLKEAAL